MLIIQPLTGKEDDLRALLLRGGLPTLAKDLAGGLKQLEWVVGARAEGGELVGMAFALVGQHDEPGGPVCLLHQVLVDDAHRRRGAGTTLVLQVMNDARLRGARRIRLRMHPPSERAAHRAFYGRLGFGDGDHGPDTLAADL